MRPGVLAQPDWRTHVDAKGALKEFLFLCLNGLIADPTRVVDQDIQRAELLDGQRYELLAAILVIQVPAVGDERSTVDLQGMYLLAHHVWVSPVSGKAGSQVANDYPCATLQEGLGVSVPKPPATASDNRYLVFERLV